MTASMAMAASGTTRRAAAGAGDDEVARLVEAARRIRVETIKAVHHANVGHLGGPLSAADVLAALYFRVMRIRPEEPGWPDRDRFVLSKGHSAIGLYATLALRGYFPVEELLTFDAAGSRMQGHPDMTITPGIDMSSGSLGVGLSGAVGIALGARLTGRDVRTFVMVGDGECQEGEVWEAAFLAPRYRLSNLVVIVDHNRLQQYGWPGDDGLHRVAPEEPGELVAKWTAFGWRVMEIDGHDMRAVVDALEAPPDADGRPTAIVSLTRKGHPISYMLGKYRWHTGPFTAEEYATALRELGEPADGGSGPVGEGVR